MPKWRAAWMTTNAGWKPFMQSLYVDLSENPNEKASSIHLGFRSGRDYLKTFLALLETYGVNHVILNLKYGKRPAAEVIEEIGSEIVPTFS